MLGSDELGWTVERAPGSSLREPGVTPASATTLSFATWTEFEKLCGQSRVWAGVHFPDAVPAGQDIGTEVARRSFKFFQDHLNNEGQAGRFHGYKAGCRQSAASLQPSMSTSSSSRPELAKDERPYSKPGGVETAEGSSGSKKGRASVENIQLRLPATRRGYVHPW